MKQPAGASFTYSLVLGLVTALSAGAATGDWPQWRGPDRDDVAKETGLLNEWPADGPPLLWKATGLGAGFATVSVANGTIYTVGDQSGSSFIVALTVSDGKVVWSAKLGKPGAPGWGGFEGPRSTPTVSSDVVVAVGQWGEIACVEAATGKERWRKDFTKDFGGERPEWGFSESPLADGDNIVFTPGGSQGSIVAVDKNTGATKWRSKSFGDNAHYSSLIVAEIGGVRQYIQLTAQSVVGVSGADGKVLWQARRRGETAVIPTPIYSDGYVYVTSSYGTGCNLFKVTTANGKFSAEQVYANKVMVNHHGGVVKVGDFVYGYSDGKGWTCQDFKTGAAKWQDKDKLGKGSVLAADGRLYLRQEDKAGTIALIEASPDGYKEHGRFNPPNRTDKQSWSHLVIAGGKLYVRDQDTLLCYNLQGK